MSQLSIPNDIVDGTLIEASEHQQNYKQIESFVNDELLHADGSVAMDSGAELLLGKAASVPLGAVTKAQLDNAVFGDVPGGGFLPLAGGTLTGDLQVNGRIRTSWGGQNAPAYGFVGDTEGLGMYGTATDQWLRFSTGGAWRLQVDESAVTVNTDLTVDGTLNAAGGGHVLSGGNQVLRLMNSAPDSKPYMSVYYNGVRSGFFGNPSASSGGTTEVHGEGNTLLLRSNVKVQVTSDLQVDGQLVMGGTWDGAKLSNHQNATREIFSIGDLADGGAQINLYGPGDASAPGYVYIYAGGVTAARIDNNQNTRLYGDLQADGRLRIAQGSGQNAPSYSFVGDTKGLGLYGNVTDQWLRFTTNGVYRLQVDESRVTVRPDLRVDGQTLAQNGTKAKPAYSFTNDPATGFYLYGTGVASIVCAGKNVANFGTAGVAFPEGLATISGTAANVHIGNDGQLRRITDVKQAPTVADINRLETLVEKLSARIDMLEGQKGL